MHAKAAFPALFLTLTGFTLMLLVTLSVPIIKGIYLLSITGPTPAGNLRAGVFGVCYEGGTDRIGGNPLFELSGYRCSGLSVGYEVDQATFFAGYGNGTLIIANGLAGALVLNPIAAGFAGISLIFALIAYFKSNRVFGMLTFITLFFASLTAWIAFALDLAVALVARRQVDNYTANGAFVARVGNGVWLALVSAILLTLGICAAGCGSFGRYSEKHLSLDDASPEPTATAMSQKKWTWPWQRESQIAI